MTFVGEVVNLDLAAGSGSIVTGEMSRSFDLTDVVDGEDRFLIVRNFALKQPISVRFTIDASNVIRSVVVIKTHLICDSPAFRSEPPMFDMRFGSADTHLINPIDIPVLLVDKRADLNAALDAIGQEERCVGLDVLPGLTDGKSSVVVLCAGRGIFVFELSLLTPSDRTLFACFIYGMQTCMKRVVYATTLSEPFGAVPSVFTAPMQTTNILAESTLKLVDLVEQRFGYRMEPVRELNDSLSCGCHFGRVAFHARQLFLAKGTAALPGTLQRPPHKLQRTAPMELQRTAPPVQKSQRTAPVPAPMRMRKTPHPLSMSPSALPLPRSAKSIELTPSPDMDTSSLMADLIERLKNSKRKAIAPENEDNVQNAKHFLHWFENSQKQ